MDLNTKAFAISGGVLGAICLAAIGFVSMRWGYGTALMEFLSDLLIGVEATIQGVVFAAIWGFVKGFIGCGLLAWIYNRFI